MLKNVLSESSKPTGCSQVDFSSLVTLNKSHSTPIEFHSLTYENEESNTPALSDPWGCGDQTWSDTFGP